jgi:hypothetical protein
VASYWPANLLLYSVYKGHFGWVVKSVIKGKELSCHQNFSEWTDRKRARYGIQFLEAFRWKIIMIERKNGWRLKECREFSVFSHCHTERPFHTLFHRRRSFVTLNDHFWHHPIHQWLPKRRFRHINRYPSLNRKNKCIYFLHLLVYICVPIYYIKSVYPTGLIV